VNVLLERGLGRSSASKTTSYVDSGVALKGGAAALLVAERFDRIEVGGLDRGEEAEHHADGR
jgi:hypothetical protein